MKQPPDLENESQNYRDWLIDLTKLQSKAANATLKIALSAALSALITGFGALLFYPRNLPTKDDLARQINDVQQQIVTLQAAMTSNQAQNAAALTVQQDELTKMRIQVGKISYSLKIPDNNTD